ncbi:MAG: GNAT family N-acetyltransferase [Caldilineaceae bacterium]
MEFTIRLATQTDYAQIVAIGRSATTDYVQTGADLVLGDQTRPPGVIARKLVAEAANKQLVGVATYAQSAPADDPHQFNVWFFVPPPLQGNGIGKRLYAQVMAELTPYQPSCLEIGVRSDLPRAVRFLEERGFVTANSECEMHLNLTTFNPARFQAEQQQVEREGIHLKTLAELSDDPTCDAKLYEMHLRRQAVGMEAGGLPPFSEWIEHFRQLPRLLLGGFCVAIDGEQYIGQSNALASGVSGELEYGYTGVLPAYRNRGIATAMKLKVLDWAKTEGYTLARSFSDSRNTAMIRVNQHLGFVVQPPVLWMQKILDHTERHQP